MLSKHRLQAVFLKNHQQFTGFYPFQLKGWQVLGMYSVFDKIMLCNYFSMGTSKNIFVSVFCFNIIIVCSNSLLGRGQSTAFKQGQKQNFFMTSSVEFGKINSITLAWTPNSDPQNSLFCVLQDCTLHVANVTISSLNNYPES